MTIQDWETKAKAFDKIRDMLWADDPHMFNSGEPIEDCVIQKIVDMKYSLDMFEAEHYNNQISGGIYD